VALCWLIIFSLLIIVVLAVIQRITLRRHTQVELQNAVDAAAMAAVIALADDTLLKNGEHTHQYLMDRCTGAARNFAGYNRVAGAPLQISMAESGAPHCPENELVIGSLPSFDSLLFQLLSPTAPVDIHHPDLNAAQVSLRRYEVAASATAFADHDVVGFRIPPGAPTNPLLPLAIWSDPCRPAHPDQNNRACWSSKASGSWEREIMAAPGGPSIPTMTVSLSAPPAAGDKGRVVQVGPTISPETPATAVLRQTAFGVGYADLPPVPDSSFDRQLLLDSRERNTLSLRTVPTDDLLSTLAGKLNGIRGQPRICMLYSTVQGMPPDQTATIVGFVAVRIVSVSVDSGQVAITVQPTLMNVSTAVTDYRVRNAGIRTIFNPYISKVRLVK
jgi:hypothetical protein